MPGPFPHSAQPAPWCGRRLAAPPGRSSLLRCGRSAWTRGFADGMVAAAGEWPALSRAAWPGAGLPVVVVVWSPGPGVACPKSRCLGCEPAALATESFPCCPPGPHGAGCGPPGICLHQAAPPARRATAARRPPPTGHRWGHSCSHPRRPAAGPARPAWAAHPAHAHPRTAAAEPAGDPYWACGGDTVQVMHPACRKMHTEHLRRLREDAPNPGWRYLRTGPGPAPRH